MLATLEKLFSPKVLIALNVAIILAVEFVGGGLFFAQTGLVYALAIIFVGLIFVRIFSEYAYGDFILKGFMKIQLAFFLFLGLIHVYEYLGLHVWMFSEDTVELSAMAAYLVWLFGIILADEFVFRIYNKKGNVITVLLGALVAVLLFVIVGVNASNAFEEALHGWMTQLILLSIGIFGIVSIVSTQKIRSIMPVFREYAKYSIPAIGLIIATAFSEYLEAIDGMEMFGISDAQNIYISHFFIYIALSLLLIGYGKLKKPQGIYADM